MTCELRPLASLEFVIYVDHVLPASNGDVVFVPYTCTNYILPSILSKGGREDVESGRIIDMVTIMINVGLVGDIRTVSIVQPEILVSPGNFGS